MSTPNDSLTPGSPEQVLILLGEVRQALKEGNAKRNEMIERLDGVETTLSKVAAETRKNSAAVRFLEIAMKDYEPMLKAISTERREAEEAKAEARKAKATEWSRMKIGVLLIVASSLISSFTTAVAFFTATRSPPEARS